MVKTLIQHIASTQQAIENCIASNNQEWKVRHEQSLDALEKCLPSGAGIDCGTKIIGSTPNYICFNAEYHVMTDGSYDGWEEFTIGVKPSFSGLEIVVGHKPTSRDHDIMESLADYLHETFDCALNASYEAIWDAEKGEIRLLLVK
jgi:hypothetical protein